MDNMELGKNIQRRREQKGLSQDELAESVGISTVFISRIEQGKKTPSLSNLVKIANVISASADDLLGNQIENHYEIKTSKLGEKINHLPLSEQKRIHDVVDVMISHYNVNG